MTRTPYFPHTPGGVWAASRYIHGRWVALIEGSPVYRLGDAESILEALGLAPTLSNLDRYFPMRGDRMRRPTLDRMEMFSRLPHGHGADVCV